MSPPTTLGELQGIVLQNFSGRKTLFLARKWIFGRWDASCTNSLPVGRLSWTILQLSFTLGLAKSLKSNSKDLRNQQRHAHRTLYVQCSKSIRYRDHPP